MIVVTGAAGFIGSVLARDFNERGFQDLLLVDYAESTHPNLQKIQYSQYFEADEFLSQLKGLTGIEAIFHMGACSSTAEQNMDYLEKVNIHYSKTLFEYCAEKSIPLIYASSAATYGGGEQGYKDDHAALDTLKPLNKYGLSKQLVDQWALKQTQTPSKWFGLKFFNVYGPNEYHKGSMRSVVQQAFEQIRDKGEVKLFQSHHPDYEDGGQMRDFVYVKDICQAMIGLWKEGKPEQSGLYNLGTGKARTFKELVEATFKALEQEPKISFIPTPEHLREQYQYYTCADMDKLLNTLPSQTFLSLEEGVADYVQGYLVKDNPYY